uniref:DNA repair protein REV1 n=1 Tax=Glossina brevipalpis TaxID=37001 RepID=A0A1A9WC86_9MUSC
MMDNGFDEWGGYMQAKITKLEEQFSNASNPFKKTDLFAGISIFVNGLTNPSSDELKRIMMTHGGVFHHYERSHTRFIIAENLPDVKVRNLNTSKIISPQWVVDCVKEKRILDYSRYLLYTNQKTSQPSIDFSKTKKTDLVKQSSGTKAETKEIQNQLANIKKGLTELNAKIRESSSSTDRKAALTSNTALTAVDPKFLNEFFNNSRLHHIATLGAGFKQYISELRQQRVDQNFPARQQLKEKLAKIYKGQQQIVNTGKPCFMHIDMDCFFVSVGLRKHPHLRGQPVAVTHSKGGSSDIPVHPQANREAEMKLFEKRFQQHLHNNILSDKVRGGFESKLSLSEIASASYEARAKGIRNGMFVGQALILCPELKTIPYDFEGYREVAFTFYNTIVQYTLDIEAVSCDEMFVDLSDVLKYLQIPVMDFVEAVREEVKQKTGCPCSAGVGTNKLQARMATKKAKPDGQYYLESDYVETYMSDIPIEELPGVGSSTAYNLKEVELVSCGDLQNCSLTRLQALVGKKLGETLYHFCRGIDSRPLVFEQVRKSISAEVNYGIRFNEYTEAETFLKQLSEEVTKRLKDIKRKTKCLTLKLMIRAKDAPLETSKFMGHGVCDHITKSVHLSAFTDDLEIIMRTALTIMKSLNLPPNELRGIGIQLTKLDEPNAAIDEPKVNIIKEMFSKVKEKQKETAVMKTKEEEKKICGSVKFGGKENVVLPVKERQLKTTREKKGSKRAHIVEMKDTHCTPDVINMLKNNSNKQQNFEKDIIPTDIDPEVFKCLPLNIKNEILKERGFRALTEKSDLCDFNKSDSQPSTSKAPEANTHRIPDIISMLKNNANKRRNFEKQTIPTDVDREVFNALPSHIKTEILKERGFRPLTEILSSTSNLCDFNESDLQPSTSTAAAAKRLKKELKSEEVMKPFESSQIDSTFLDALPIDIRTEIQNQMKISIPSLAESSTEIARQRNIFQEGNCQQLLLAWVESTNTPESRDIELICHDARHLVRIKKLDQLYNALFYMTRLLNGRNATMSSQDCLWHAALKLLLETVDKEMRLIFDGGKLYLPIKLKCDKCTSDEQI